ncbi:hypothetical protein BESB_033240 [Besnoitia besnoiti]|uniref:Transmembrane protein n=1 Tax=Besnoitia besnoiti TaxID=94643 RepID=A0A2A9M416_BESBE|nr:uncharacterized protein BESB_033240 [Besnoitia besnoiti]PFH31051.1 hypothetical protein BESB_033240 [Besnoitia besnoiti]
MEAVGRVKSPPDERPHYAVHERRASLSCSDVSCLKNRASHAFSALTRKRMKNTVDGRLWSPAVPEAEEDADLFPPGGDLEPSCFSSVFEREVKPVSASQKGQPDWISATRDEEAERQGLPEKRGQLGLERIETAWSRNLFRFPGLSSGGQAEEGKPEESDSGAPARFVGVPNLLMFLMSVGSPLGAQQAGSPRLSSFFPPSFLPEKTWPLFTRSADEQAAEHEEGRPVHPSSGLAPEKVSDSRSAMDAAPEPVVASEEESCPAHGGREEVGGREESVTDVLRSTSVSQVVAEWAASLGAAEEVVIQTVPFVTEEAARLLWKSACSLILNPVVAFYCQCYTLASLGALVFTTSIVHWWRPQLGIRRTVDVTAVVFVAAIHWMSAFLLTDFSFQVVYFLISSTGITCYFGGCALTSRGRSMPGAWCHVGLHVICTIGNLCLYLYLALQAEGDAKITGEISQAAAESFGGECFTAAVAP